MSEQRQIKAWITRNGKHIPIYDSDRSRQPATKTEYEKALKNRELASQAFRQVSKKRANLNNIGDASVEDAYRNLMSATKEVENIEKRGIIKSVRFKKSVPQQNSDIREKQIAENKAQADRLNKNNLPITNIGNPSSINNLKTQADVNKYLKLLEAEAHRGEIPGYVYTMLKQRALAQRDKLSKK